MGNKQVVVKRSLLTKKNEKYKFYVNHDASSG